MKLLFELFAFGNVTRDSQHAHHISALHLRSHGEFACCVVPSLGTDAQFVKRRRFSLHYTRHHLRGQRQVIRMDKRPE